MGWFVAVTDDRASSIPRRSAEALISVEQTVDDRQTGCTRIDCSAVYGRVVREPAVLDDESAGEAIDATAIYARPIVIDYAIEDERTG